MPGIRIRFIAPTTDHRPSTLAAIAEDLQALAAPGLELSHVQIEGGALMVRSEEDERRAAPGVLRRVLEAAQDGVDAVVIDCTGDVGLAEARALVPIPVIGPGEVLRARTRGRQALWLSADVLEGDPLPTVLEGLANGAEVVVMGGTGWSPVAAALRRSLRDRGSAAEVLDPLPLAVEEAVRGARALQRG